MDRRSVLGAGVGAAAVVGAGAAGYMWGSGMPAEVDQAKNSDAYAATTPFQGEVQAGIVTPPQQFLSLLSFDVPQNADADVLRRWLTIQTENASNLTAGKPTLTDFEPDLAAQPANLTITFGFGEKVFALTGKAALKPEWVRPLPKFKIDQLRPEYSGGDLVVQICGNNPVSVAHAERVMIKDSRTLVNLRWIQHGFRPVSNPDGSMRNLMGQVDGVENPSPEQKAVIFDQSAESLLHNSTGLVVRRIQMELDTWDELDPPAKEQVVGRRLDGVPLAHAKVGKPGELPSPDFHARDEDGLLKIPEFSHIRRAHASRMEEQILRRPYNYAEPLTPELINAGKDADAGLVFIAYCADVDKQYVPMQERLAELDLLNQWTTPIGSAVFFVPAGLAEGEKFIGEKFFS